MPTLGLEEDGYVVNAGYLDRREAEALHRARGEVFVFVRLIMKLSTNWNDTTPTHVARAPCSTELPNARAFVYRSLISHVNPKSPFPSINERDPCTP